MMKTAYFGWEAAAMSGNTVKWLVPVVNPIVLCGYEINLSMMPTSWSLFQSGKTAEVLVQAAFGATDLNNDFGPPSLGLGVAGNAIQNGIFATGILKAWEPSAVNDILTNSGLAINIPAEANFTMLAAHLGYPMDFEVQGILYYDTQ